MPDLSITHSGRAPVILKHHPVKGAAGPAHKAEVGAAAGAPTPPPMGGGSIAGLLASDPAALIAVIIMMVSGKAESNAKGAYNSQVAKDQAQINKELKKIAEEKSKIGGAKGDIGKAKKELAQLDKKEKALRTQLASLKSQVSSAKNEINKLKHELTPGGKDNKAIKAHIQRLEKRLKTIKTEMAADRKALSADKTEAAGLHGEISHDKDVIHTAEGVISGARTGIAAAKSDITAAGVVLSSKMTAIQSQEQADLTFANKMAQSGKYNKENSHEANLRSEEKEILVKLSLYKNILKSFTADHTQHEMRHFTKHMAQLNAAEFAVEVGRITSYARAMLNDFAGGKTPVAIPRLQYRPLV